MGTDKIAWRKAARSNANGGACVEVAANRVAGIKVRDSKNPEGARLRFDTAEWGRFLSRVKTDAI